MTEHNTPWSDETLMAWADGELPQAQVAELEAALLADAALAKRAAAMMDTRAWVKQAWDAELAQPVPDALLASVQAMVAKDQAQRAQAQAAASVPPEPQTQLQTQPQALAPNAAAGAPMQAPKHADMRPGAWQRVQRWLGQWFSPMPMALAASALCAGLGFVLGSSQLGAGGHDRLASATGLTVGQTVSPKVAQALGQTPSGQRVDVAQGTALVPMATYALPSGAVCREFSLQAPESARVEALACRQGEAPWQVQVAMQVPEDEGFAPAEAEIGLLAPMLGQLGAGEALSASDEQAALQRLSSAR